jgi:superfamily I DNA and RNA helicase
LIDESQDFSESFFSLCELITSDNIYVAGDIFQSIFDNANENQTNPDFLLSKCYRTDPRTLMFAHGLGMGLFESRKLKWLEEDEWKACGYNVKHNKEDRKVSLAREPLRRFEDLESENHTSVEIIKSDFREEENIIENTLKLIREIIEKIQPFNQIMWA